MDSYVYTQLNPLKHELRFLKVLPAVSKKSICCTMIQATLENYPPYEALSYAWGEDGATHSIYVDGKVFMVRENLMHALQHLRSNFISRLLWIDAVCINQGNEKERGEQVLHMRQIYNQASRVLVWLGVEGPEDNMMRLFDQQLFGHVGFFRSWKAISKSLDIMLRNLENHLEKDPQNTLENIDPAESISNIKLDVVYALSHFLNRAWFERVWVIQEVTAARNVVVICGKSEMKWLDFLKGTYNAVRCINTILPSFPKFIESMERAYEESVGEYRIIEARHFENPLKAFDDLKRAESNLLRVNFFRSSEKSLFRFRLEDVIEHMRSCKATDPRDRVYAALGIIPLRKVAIIPNYALDISTVFRETARSIVLDSNSLNLLRFCQPGSGLNLASWIPDWHQLRTTPLLMQLGVYLPTLDGKYAPYNASKNQKSDFTLDDSSDCLFVRGVYVTTIWEIDVAPGDRAINWLSAAIRCGIGPYIENLRRRPIGGGSIMTREETQLRSLRYLYGGSIGDAFALTITGNRYKYGGFFGDMSPPKDKQHSEALIRAVYKLHHKEPSKHSYDQTPPWYIPSYFVGFEKAYRLSSEMTAQEQISLTISRRGFFISKEGHMGTCPIHAKSDDIVVVLKGMEVPLVLRRVEMGNYYIVIGEAYIHGIMEEGEAFLGEQVDERTFEIR